MPDRITQQSRSNVIGITTYNERPWGPWRGQNRPEVLVPPNLETSRAFPSHGRGRRFDPYSAHQIFQQFSAMRFQARPRFAHEIVAAWATWAPLTGERFLIIGASFHEFSSANARWLVEISERNRLRQQFGLPRLSITKELRQMKTVEVAADYARFCDKFRGRVRQKALARIQRWQNDP